MITTTDAIRSLAPGASYAIIDGEIVMPPWVGSKEFHQSHKSNLTRKQPEYYSKYWSVSPHLPYIWPGQQLNESA